MNNNKNICILYREKKISNERKSNDYIAAAGKIMLRQKLSHWDESHLNKQIGTRWRHCNYYVSQYFYEYLKVGERYEKSHDSINLCN